MKYRLAENVTFTPVSPDYRKVVWISNFLVDIPILIILLVPAFIWGSTSFPGLLWWIAVAAFIIFAVWMLWLELRQARVLGYAETDEELIIRSGIMFHKIVVVPYGRMQQVNVSSGPLLRKFDLAQVKLVTAAATTNAEIPGISRAEAERLREKLTALGQTQMEGL